MQRRYVITSSFVPSSDLARPTTAGRRLLVTALTTTLLLFAVLSVVGAAAADDLADLVVRFERGFNDKDAVTFQSCFCDDAVYINPPNRNEGPTHEVITGKALRDLLEMSTRQPVTAGGELLVIDGTGVFTRLEHGNIADMLLTAAVRVRRSGDQPARIGFLEERFTGTRRGADGTWRFAFFFPRFVDPRVVVTAVAPNSQAERLGVRPGDIITHYLMMEMILSRQIPWRWRMFVDDPPDRPLRVLARRGGQVLTFIFQPGDMGVTTRNHFEGRSGTLSLAGAEAREHPAAKTVDQYLVGLRNAHADQLTAALGPDGYHFHRGLPGDEMGDPITHADAADSLPRALDRLRERWDLSSLRFSDLRFIIHANLALGGWRMCAKKRDEGLIDRHVVVALARTAVGWRIVGTPWQDDQILGIP
jgi:hypothetical protein